MASAIDWPESLGCVLHSGYTVSPRSGVLETDFRYSVRRRRIYTHQRQIIQAAWIFDGEQESDFREFFTTTLGYGTRTFNVPLQLDGVYGPVEVSFIEAPPRFSLPDAAGYVRMDCTFITCEGDSAGAGGGGGGDGEFSVLISFEEASYSGTLDEDFILPVVRTLYDGIEASADYRIVFDGVDSVVTHVGDGPCSYPANTYVGTAVLGTNVYYAQRVSDGKEQPEMLESIDVPIETRERSDGTLLSSSTLNIALDTSDYDPPPGYPPSFPDETECTITGWVENYPSADRVSLAYRRWFHNFGGIPNGTKAVWTLNGAEASAAITHSELQNVTTKVGWYFNGNIYVRVSGQAKLFKFSGLSDTAVLTRTFTGTGAVCRSICSYNEHLFVASSVFPGSGSAVTLHRINPSDLTTIESWTWTLDSTDTAFSMQVEWDPECNIRRCIHSALGTKRVHVWALPDGGGAATSIVDESTTLSAYNTQGPIVRDSVNAEILHRAFWFGSALSCTREPDRTGTVTFPVENNNQNITVVAAPFPFTATLSNPEPDEFVDLGPIIETEVDLT